MPDVLTSGDHARIRAWRREQAIRRTAELRPDLLDKAGLTPEEQRFADELLADACRRGEGDG